MQILPEIGVILLAYLIGAIPFGLLVVKLKTGKDVREVESGRTGGTNAMRAAGFWAGFITAMLDILKGAGAVWLAAWLSPAHWAHVAAPLAAILGHNYSIFLLTRDEKGRVRLGGGAGGAPSVGGAIGLWPGSVLIIL
ncbi:MAG: glycerol-3-phosphate acyltransferase, partial [Chloroflexi bacterium]|nr:glycerol-3-phosphate acyltransferase [Chloroflexota bacterium]